MPLITIRCSPEERRLWHRIAEIRLKIHSGPGPHHGKPSLSSLIRDGLNAHSVSSDGEKLVIG